MSNIFDINQDDFIEKVIEKSKEIPVLVDFWAPWCGPCKQLTPILEKLINSKKGKILLAKINVESNQGIASQLNIQSIPTVYGFVDGQPIDAFQGLQPESKIEIMINKLIDATPGNEIPKLLEEAETLFKDQMFEEAQKIYENLVTLDTGNDKVISGLLRCLVQLQKFDEAKEIMESLDESIIETPDIKKITKLLDNIDNHQNPNSINEIETQLKQNPEDKDLRFELSVQLLKSNQIEKGFEELLYLFEQDPKWHDERVKKILLEYFDLLGFNDPNVMNARKKLSSLMFK